MYRPLVLEIQGTLPWIWNSHHKPDDNDEGDTHEIAYGDSMETRLMLVLPRVVYEGS